MNEAARARESHGKRSKRMGDGNPCPKCGKTMGRYRHHQDFLPRDRVFHRWWDKCTACGHVQFYAEARSGPEDGYQPPRGYYRASGSIQFDGRLWVALDGDGNTIGVCAGREEAWRLADSCGMVEVQLGGIDGQDQGRGVEVDPDGGEQSANSPDNSTA